MKIKVSDFKTLVESMVKQELKKKSTLKEALNPAEDAKLQVLRAVKELQDVWVEQGESGYTTELGYALRDLFELYNQYRKLARASKPVGR